MNTIFRSFPIALVLLLGAGMYVLDLDAVIPYHYACDEYNAANHAAGRGFVEFVRDFRYGKAMNAQFWICDRLFDGSPGGWRAPGAAAGVLALALMVLASRMFWPQKLLLPLIVIYFAAFNAVFLGLFRYGMATYGEYVMASMFLLLAFLRILRGRLGKGWLILFVCASLVFPWFYMCLLIPFAAGFALLALARARKSDRGMARGLMGALWELKYFAPGFAMFAIPKFARDDWGAAFRDQLKPLYFNLSGYPQDFAGALSFILDRTGNLFESMAAVLTGFSYAGLDLFSYGVDSILGGSCLVMLGVGVVTSLAKAFLKRDGNDSRLFLVAFIVVCVAGMCGLSLLGLYPYGNPRYAVFLIFPVLFLAGLGLCDCAEWVLARPLSFLLGGFTKPQRRLGLLLRIRQTFYWSFSAVVIVAMALQLQWHLDRRSRKTRAWERMVSMVQWDVSDHTMADTKSFFWLRHFAPDIWKRANWIDPNAGISDDLEAALKTSDSVLFIDGRPGMKWWEIGVGKHRRLGDSLSRETFAEDLSVRQGTWETVRLVRKADIPTIRHFSPRSTTAGKGFDVRPNGMSRMSLRADGATSESVVMFAGVEVSTKWKGPGKGAAVQIPPELLAEEGTYAVYLYDEATGRQSAWEYFKVKPRAGEGE